MLLITTLWAWQFRYLSVHLTACLAHISSSCLWGTYERQCQKPYWCQGKQYPLLSPCLPSQSFHHGRLLGLSSMTVPLRILADYSWSASCLSWIWQWFPELVVPSCSQGLRWDWQACSFLGFPSWRYEQHLLSFSLQTLLPVTIHQRLSRVGQRLLSILNRICRL